MANFDINSVNEYQLKRIKWFLRFLKEYDYYIPLRNSLTDFFLNINDYLYLPYYRWPSKLTKNFFNKNIMFFIDSNEWSNYILYEEYMQFNWCCFLYENNIYDNVIEGFEKLYNSISPNLNYELYYKLKKLLNK